METEVATEYFLESVFHMYVASSTSAVREVALISCYDAFLHPFCITVLAVRLWVLHLIVPRLRAHSQVVSFALPLTRPNVKRCDNRQKHGTPRCVVVCRRLRGAHRWIEILPCRLPEI